MSNGNDRSKRAELPDEKTWRPFNKQDHDVLVFPRPEVIGKYEYFRHPVAKHPENGRPGEFRYKPERWEIGEDGARRVHSVARNYELGVDGRPQNLRGPAFAAVPIKPEPEAAHFITCYLINVEHLSNPNFWTIEEWNDGPLGVDYPTPAHPPDFEFLAALPWGMVFRFKISRENWRPGKAFCIVTRGDARHDLRDGCNTQPGDEPMAEIECVALKQEPEIWSQLRSGCIAGRVKFSRRNKPIPLVNVTALDPWPEDTATAGEPENETTRGGEP